MSSYARLLLLAALPTLAGRGFWAGGEVVEVTAARPALAARGGGAVTAAVGGTAELLCDVTGLGDKAVSWIRSRDLQILSHAGAVFTADARVAAVSAEGDAGGESRHVLRIERLRLADGGRYECQLNTEPKMSLFFNLTVVDEPMPVVVVELAARQVSGAVGGAATLACEARYEPAPRALQLPPLDVHWYKGEWYKLISLQGGRGGVSLDTERWAARTVSRLTLTALAPDDAGRYECAAGGLAKALQLDVVDHAEAQLEAMQRDQGAQARVAGAAGSRRALLPLLPLVALLLNS